MCAFYRDRFMLPLPARSVPVAVVMPGGYAPAVEGIVDLHAHTVLEAAHRHSTPTPEEPAWTRKA